MAGNKFKVIGSEIHIDPSVLSPGTAAIRHVVLQDKRGRVLVRQVESWALHRHDLETVCAVMKHLGDETWPAGASVLPSVRSVAMLGAVTAYFRCFDSDARHNLQSEQVFRRAREGLTVHRYWKGLRDGQLVHDSNPWTDARALAELNAEGRPIGIYAICMLGSSTDPIHVESFSGIARHAFDWVSADLQRVNAELREAVAKLGSNEINAFPVATWSAPSAEKVGDRR